MMQELNFNRRVHPSEAFGHECFNRRVHPSIIIKDSFFRFHPVIEYQVKDENRIHIQEKDGHESLAENEED
jgi:hypothetical protein